MSKVVREQFRTILVDPAPVLKYTSKGDTMTTKYKQSASLRIVVEDDLANEVLICGARHFKAINTTEAVKELLRFALDELAARHKDSPTVPDGHADTPNLSSQGGDDNGNTV